MTDIKETTELVTFVAHLVRGIIDANADGKLSKWEEVKLVLGNVGDAAAAFKGISLVPGELAGLDSAKMDELYAAAMGQLKLAEHSQARLIFTATVNFTDICIRYFHDIKNALYPPKAEAVPE